MKHIKLMLLIFLALLLCSCNKNVYSSEDIYHNTMDTAEATENIEDDYIIMDGSQKIVLGGLFRDFISEYHEVSYSYVGEITEGSGNGEKVYRYYCHDYGDFVIYTSHLTDRSGISWGIGIEDKDENLIYDKDFTISQIIVTGSSFKTWRGLSVGMTYNEAEKLYGEFHRTDEASGEYDFYMEFDNINISIQTDEEGIIKSIVLTYNR